MIKYHLMADTIGPDAPNIPAIFPAVAAYITGGPGIAWAESELARFKDKPVLQINQSSNPDFLEGMVFDCEDGAMTMQTAVEGAVIRQEHGRSNRIYISRSRAVELTESLHEHDVHQCDLWIADWSLTMAEAVALLGTTIGGYRVGAVQWASPTSNPTTMLPHSMLTLKQANVDLSVALDGWLEDGAKPKPAPRPRLMVITFTSADGGKTWVKSA